MTTFPGSIARRLPAAIAGSCLATALILSSVGAVAGEGAPAAVSAIAPPMFGFDRFKLRGRLQVDFGQIGAPSARDDPALGTFTTVRRARLGAEGDKDGFGFVLEVDFAGNDVSVEDGFVYWDDGTFRIAVGNLKPKVSMEEETDDLFSPFLERAAFTTAFEFGYTIGAAASMHGENYSLQAGLLSTRSLNESAASDGYIPSFRATFSPALAGGRLHFAASTRYRKKPAEDGRVHYRREPQIHNTDIAFVDTGELAVQSDLFLGAETGAFLGPFYVTGEWGSLKARLSGQPRSTANLLGGYLGAGYILTGESYPYDPRSGTTGRIVPERPFASGGPGAFAVNLRFDFLELNDVALGIDGGKQGAVMAGITWIPHANTRLLATYSRLRVNGGPFAAVANPGNPARTRFGANVFGLRAQIDW
ncbi:MAG: OprO/OprP family phosphate-selective porin [Rhodothalassiaceae bacterium]